MRGVPARGRFRLVKAGAPVQVGSAGPYRLNETVPVGVGAGAGAPTTVAVSRMGAPRVTGVRAWVVMVANAWVTTDVSLVAPHGLVVDW